MKIKTINKISAFLVALIAVTIAIDFIILQGGFFVGKVSAVELARFRPAYNKNADTVSREVVAIYKK